MVSIDVTVALLTNRSIREKNKLKKTYYLPSTRNIVFKAPLGSFFALLWHFAGAISSIRGGSLKHWFVSNEG